MKLEDGEFPAMGLTPLLEAEQYVGEINRQVEEIEKQNKPKNQLDPMIAKVF